MIIFGTDMHLLIVTKLISTLVLQYVAAVNKVKGFGYKWLT